MFNKTSFLVATALAVTMAGAAHAAWQPTKPVEFVVTSSPGGGTDNFARVVQSIIA
jgi:putative tricarboxylic transport membrane protein